MEFTWLVQVGKMSPPKLVKVYRQSVGNHIKFSTVAPNISVPLSEILQTTVAPNTHSGKSNNGFPTSTNHINSARSPRVLNQ